MGAAAVVRVAAEFSKTAAWARVPVAAAARVSGEVASRIGVETERRVAAEPAKASDCAKAVDAAAARVSRVTGVAGDGAAVKDEGRTTKGEST